VKKEKIQVKVDQAKLKLYKISLQQVVEAINRSGLDLPRRKSTNRNRETKFRSFDREVFRLWKTLKTCRCPMPIPGSPVYVKDVADINRWYKRNYFHQ
jgi:HAE1 family hydrophobic/amphiphilic exporter-1